MNLQLIIPVQATATTTTTTTTYPGGPHRIRFGRFPSLPIARSRTRVSSLPTTSSNFFGRYFSIHGTWYPDFFGSTTSIVIGIGFGYLMRCFNLYWFLVPFHNQIRSSNGQSMKNINVEIILKERKHRKQDKKWKQTIALLWLSPLNPPLLRDPKRLHNLSKPPSVIDLRVESRTDKTSHINF